MKRIAIQLMLAGLVVGSTAGSEPRTEVLGRVQLATAKVYGEGGVAGLEGYQTGVFIDDAPAVLTVDSPVLGSGRVTLIDAFGDRHQGRVLARDPLTGLVLLGYPDSVTPPGGVEFKSGATAPPAAAVWVVSNAFGIAAGDEPVTVQRGRVAVTTRLPIPRGLSRPRVGVPEASTTVVLLDAITSNPGAAGGVVVDNAGRVVGVLGAECRSPLTGAWINYALPADSAAAAVERMLANPGSGRSEETLVTASRWRSELRQAGLTLLPVVGPLTPAFVEQVDPASLAGGSGCQPDDLIVAIGGVTVGDVESAGAAIVRAWREQGRAELTVLRDRQVLTLTLQRDAP